MKISENSMFKIGYTSTLSNNIKTKKRRTSLFKKIFKNKIITISITIILVGICCNIILLYNFFRILERIN